MNLPPFEFLSELSFVHAVIVIVAIAILAYYAEKRRLRRYVLNMSKRRELRSFQGDSVECPVQFGYLRSLPSGSSVPDECNSCPRLAQCAGLSKRL